MTKQITRHWGKPAVQVSGSAGATIGAAVLLAAWVVIMVGALLMPATTGLLMMILATGVLGVPAWILSQRGRRRRFYIKALLEARSVPGGTLVTVLDDRGVRHELVMSEAAALGLANVLAENAPHPTVTP